MAKDPYELSADEHSKIKDDMKLSSGGVVCPKYMYNKPCKVCDYIRPLWGKYPKGSKERNIFSQRAAKASFFANVVFKTKPSVAMILEIGKRVGDRIIDNINDPEKLWGRWIVHPKAGVGREMTLKKNIKDGYPNYEIDPALDRADWDVPKEALDNVYNLDNILDMIKNGELGDSNHFRVSSLKEGESVNVRFLPPWEGSKVILKPVFRHWGVTQEEVDGTAPFSISFDVEDKKDSGGAVWNETNLSMPKSTGKKCFGQAEFFNMKDEECFKCPVSVECSKAVS
uniref:Uncharacterized protein n=1 Tax=viral metagenome TaxID=1070528 RepID=A0A6M3LEE4_9ZZZZ